MDEKECSFISRLSIKADKFTPRRPTRHTRTAGWHVRGQLPCRVDRDALERQIDELVDAHRDRCLWFVSADYRPRTDEERRWALTQIQRRCDRAAFTRAAILKRWLSPISSDASAVS